MNQKTLVLLLTVVKISMGAEIYLTHFTVFFDRPRGGENMQANEYKLAYMASG